MPKITVAMVEDDPLILRINRTFLEELPFARLIWEATTIGEALEKFKQPMPDLLLLDIFLPDNSGLFLLKQLKAAGKFPATIMITAAAEVQTVTDALESGVYDYLIKPYLKERFIQAITDFYQANHPQRHYTQLEVDQMIGQRKEQQEVALLPKGLNYETLAKIIAQIKVTKSGVTAEELAKSVGIAVVSARRYLHYLTQVGKIKYQPIYGQQGRPAHRYLPKQP